MRKFAFLACLSFFTISGFNIAAEVPFSAKEQIDGDLFDPARIALADLDGDGDQDLLAAVTGDPELGLSAKIVWLENLGDSLTGGLSFGPQEVISTEPFVQNATGVAAADVDGDGKLDAISSSDGNIAWYRNLGGGDFGDPASNQKIISTDFTLASAVIASDIDRDGLVDVIATSTGESPRLAWFENVAGGVSWSEHSIGSLVAVGRSVATADLDRDGDLDVLSASSSINAIAWFVNNDGLGGFDPFLAISSTVLDGRAVTTADLDGDGDEDILSASCTDNTVAWYENDGSPVGDTFFPNLISTGIVCPRSLTAVDLDADNDIDLLLASDDGVFWFEQIPSAGAVNFAPARPIGAAAGGATDIRATDLDGDGDQDVVVAYGPTNEIAWFENRTIHRNADFPLESVIDDTLDTITAVAADIDRDGLPDVVSGAFSDTFIGWWRNLGSGNFGASSPISLNSSGTLQVLVADFDRDATPDVASASVDFGLIWYPNAGGLGTFPLSDQIIEAGDFGGEFPTIAAGDFDADGDLDLAAGEGSRLRVYANTDGAGTFALIDPDGAGPLSPDLSTVVNGAEVGVISVFASDINGDGKLDLLAGGMVTVAGGTAVVGNGKIFWYENSGAGIFGPPLEIATTATTVNSVVVGDFDGDGDPDAVAGSESSIDWFANLGAGAFGAATLISSDPESVDSLAVSDLDGDGDLDVIFASSDHGVIAWHENLAGSGNFAPRKLISAFAVGARSVFTADLDGDGDQDVLAASEGVPLGTRLAWYENQGGQVTLSGDDIAPALAPAGRTVAILKITLRLNARTGDSIADLASLSFEFFNAAAAPLSDAQANALLGSLSIFRDADNSGQFDAGDIPLANTTPAGNVTLTLADGDINATLAAETNFFLVVEMSAGAASANPNSFSAALSGVTVEDTKTDLPLTAASSTPIESKLITAQAVLSVTTLGDLISPEDGEISLREAVIQANTNPGPDQIFLEPGTYVLSREGSGENAAATGDLDVTDGTGTLTIIGAGADKTTVDANGIDRVFEVIGANLTLQGVTITGGRPPEGTSRGGGIGHFCCSLGTVTLIDSVVTGNSATFSGAVDNNSPLGAIVLIGSTIWGNTAGQGSAISLAFGTLSVINSTIADNTGSKAILSFQDSVVEVRNSTITGNTGGIQSTGNIPAKLSNSIVALNAVDVQGTFNSLGHNLIGDLGSATGLENGVNGDLVGGGLLPVLSPVLGALQDNGGPSLTRAPLGDSPALDAGACPGETSDQRGFPRPFDVAGVANATDGCDIGAVESALGQVLTRINVPVRWCAVEGTPSIGSDQSLANSVLLSRTRQASENIFEPLAAVRFRSGAGPNVQDFFILPDPVPSPGGLGDVFIDPEARNFDEFLQLIASCRVAWEALDPSVVGITAVHVNRIVDSTGAATSILGLGGRAELFNAAEQAVAGRVMVIDSFYRQSVIPPDTSDRLLGHEFGHAAMALVHDNGLDEDGNGVPDEDAAFDLPAFDGPNLMQYREGTQLTDLQILIGRAHLVLTIPDLTVTTSVSADEVPIDDKRGRKLDFGHSEVLDFASSESADLKRGRKLDFEEEEVLDFGHADIIDFGMDVSGTDSSVIFSSTAGLPWPEPIRTDTSYYYYLDLDDDDTTGALPGLHGFPAPDPGVGSALGTDLIAVVVNTATGDSLTVFGFDTDVSKFVELCNDTDTSGCTPVLDNVSVGIFQATSGAEPAREDMALGTNVQAVIPNSILKTAAPAWTSESMVNMVALTVKNCNQVTQVGIAVNCECQSCDDCPDFPGCASGEGGEPEPTDPNQVLVESVASPLEFVAPVLPECTVTPGTAQPGELVSVSATDFPAGLANSIVEVSAGGALLGTGSLDSGAAVVQITIPLTTVPGELEIEVRHKDLANTATCSVTVGPADLCANDVLAPALSGVPDPVTVNADNTCSATVSLSATATDNCDLSPTVASDAPASFPLGMTTVTFTATDASGNVSTATTTVTVEDKTGPVIQPLVPDPLMVTCTQLTPDGKGCAKIVNPEIQAWLSSAAATDNCDAAPAVTNDAPDVFLIHAGTSADPFTIVTFASVDSSGNVATEVDARVQVSYEFGGFLPPLLLDGSASIKQSKKGRTLPIKFQVTCGGTPVETLAPLVSVLKILDSASGTVDTTDMTEVTGAGGDVGNTARYDPEAKQYIFNLSTKGMDAPATFRIFIDLFDGKPPQSVDFSLRK